MDVVGLLGERYLWVDCLCIVQDDQESLYNQVNNMASIFGDACVTIIAAQGTSAHCGLRGLPNISAGRDLP
jgi:Heterokaryon incompatibility protein (HET)